MAVHEALSQRVVVRHHVGGLTRDELAAYLVHLLRLAGTELPSSSPPRSRRSITPPAAKVNLLAHHALTAAALGKALTVTAEHGTPGDLVSACGVWLGRRGLAAVLADRGGRVRLAVTVARTDAARWGLAQRLAAVDADLVVDEAHLPADPIAFVAQRAGVRVWVAGPPLVGSLRAVAGVERGPPRSSAALLARIPAIPWPRSPPPPRTHGRPAADPGPVEPRPGRSRARGLSLRHLLRIGHRRAQSGKRSTQAGGGA